VKKPVYVDKVEVNPVIVERKVPVPVKAEKMEDRVTEQVGETVNVGSNVVKSDMKHNKLEPVHVDTAFIEERDTRKAPSHLSKPVYAPTQSYAPTQIVSSSPAHNVVSSSPA